MGFQPEINWEVLKVGDEIIVSHWSGHHKLVGTLVGYNPRTNSAIIRFGMAGERQVFLKDQKKRRAGKFAEPSMKLWFVDIGTIERIRKGIKK